MKYYIIAGEASGDLHGSNVIKELKKLDEDANIRAWGGDLMAATGVTLVKHYRELAFMGFAEVLMNLRTIFANLKFCKKDIIEFNPDVIVLIDYPGFNLRISKWAKTQPYKVIYYISPQVWAWKESRVPEMKKNIDKMLVILPFEKEYYETKWDWEVIYVGHPLVKVIEDYKSNSLTAEPSTSTQTSNIIALLPGSRKQEILKKLPIMLKVSKAFPKYQFIIAKAPGLEDTFYDKLVHNYPNVSSVRNETYNLLSHAKAALVTSGTATLETALFSVPQVVCYKGSFISYQIGRRLVKVKYISLVNLIMDKLLVKELIQNNLTTENLTHELSDLLNDTEKQQQLQQGYKSLKNILSESGNASAKAAGEIYSYVMAFRRR